MKKLRILSLLLLGVTCAIKADSDNNTPQSLKGGDATGQTFFWVRPQFQDAMPEKVALDRNGRALMNDCGWGGYFQAVPLGGRTTKKMGKRLARYFMFEEKDTLRVASNAVDNVDANQGINRDINPFNFNILYLNPNTTVASYQSTLSFRPRQSVVGAGFDYIQYFGWWNNCCERKWWGEISFPVLRVRNDMRLTETGIQIEAGATQVPGTAANMVEAFTGQFAGDNPWLFGKIDGKRQKTGVADVELKLGYEYIRNDCSYLYSYLGVLIPTGNTPKAEFVFEPILGENRHVGVLTGGSGGYEIWTGCGRSLWFDCDVAVRYLIRRSETRSFDLYNRPWSRYLPVFVDAAAAAADTATPGINIFTRKMKVKPGFQFDINWALVYNSECGFEAEVGYNLWARQSERISLSSPWEVGPAVANVSGDVISANVINRISNIGADFGGAAINITAVNPSTPNSLYLIQPGDLNLNSASHPATLTQIIYGSLGYGWNWCWPVNVAVGASYEFTRFNTALTRWTVWGKFGISI